MGDPIGHDTEELLRYRAELSRRLARAGVSDIGSLLDLYQQLRTALEAVSAQEIEWARAKADRLIGELERLARELLAVRRLKDRLAE
jgi:hypothetical protein